MKVLSTDKTQLQLYCLYNTFVTCTYIHITYRKSRDRFINTMKWNVSLTGVTTISTMFAMFLVAAVSPYWWLYTLDYAVNGVACFFMVGANRRYFRSHFCCCVGSNSSKNDDNNDTSSRKSTNSSKNKKNNYNNKRKHVQKQSSGGSHGGDDSYKNNINSIKKSQDSGTDNDIPSGSPRVGTQVTMTELFLQQQQQQQQHHVQQKSSSGLNVPMIDVNSGQGLGLEGMDQLTPIAISPTQSDADINTDNSAASGADISGADVSAADVSGNEIE